MINGNSMALLGGLLAFAVGSQVPEVYGQYTLSAVVAVLVYATMELRREVRTLRRERGVHADKLEYLRGALNMVAPRVNVTLPPFKWQGDDE